MPQNFAHFEPRSKCEVLDDIGIGIDILNLISEGRVKRFFQVRNKIAFEGAVCHITQRAPGDECLFIEEGDYLHMLHLIKENMKEFHYKIFAFVLMLNHLHLLIRLNKTNLSSAMKHLFEAYAKYFNKKYDRKGPVFCKPFRAALCLDDTYLLAASIYIHLNPVKAGLVEDPADYRWSSYSLYAGRDDKNTFVDYKFILDMLSEDTNKAKEYYRSLIANMKDAKKANTLESSLKNNKDMNRKQKIQARKVQIEQLISRGYKVTEIAHMLDISRRSIYNTLNFTL